MLRRWTLALICAALQVSSSAQPPRESTRPNVILITIDTLRADYLACYGNRSVETPVLDTLAGDGTLFERAHCQAPMTPPSHASILTGMYPAAHGIRDFTSPALRPGFPTLAGILKKNGYQTAAFVSAYVLDRQWGLNQGFDLYYDRFDPRDLLSANPGNVQRKAEETISLALSWLDRQRNVPYFLWLHVFDPHHDYGAPEPFLSRYSRDPYGGEVAYVDHQLGRLMVRLKQKGDYQKSLILMTSDHGEAFGEHDESDHGFFIYNTTTHIPLIIKLPDNMGRAIPRYKGVVDTVDIAPTILQITGTRRNVVMQGRGLLAELLGKKSEGAAVSYSETVYPQKTFGWSDLSSYTDGKFKYIEAPRPELYDLSADPGEKENLYFKQRALAETLRERLARFKERIATGAAIPSATVDPARLESLRALGYIAVSVPLQKRPGQAAQIDPKDRVHMFNKFRTALQAFEAGATGKANALLEEVIQEEPSLFVAHYSLGLNRLKAGENQKALGHFERAKELNPTFDLTDINRSMALAQLGKTSEAIAILEQIVRQNPNRLPAQRQLALLYSRKKDFDRAIETYREILSRRPDDALTLKSLGLVEVEAQRYQDGVGTLKKAITAGVDDAVTYNFLGIAQANTGKLQEALGSYRKSLEKKEDYHQARLNLSFALLKAGQSVEAGKEFSTLCKQNTQLCRQYEKYFP